MTFEVFSIFENNKQYPGTKFLVYGCDIAPADNGTIMATGGFIGNADTATNFKNNPNITVGTISSGPITANGPIRANNGIIGKSACRWRWRW